MSGLVETMETVRRKLLITFGRLALFMDAEKISWCEMFPLMIWFQLSGSQILFGICVSFKFLVLLFRATIGIIRLRLRVKAQELRVLINRVK